MFFTSLPLRAVSKMFSAGNIQTEGISGSLATGIQFEKMNFEDGSNSFSLEKFSFRYSLFDYFLKKEINISEINVGKMTVHIQPQSDDGSKTDQPKSPQTQRDTSQDKPLQFKNFRSVRIAKVDISNIQIDHSLLKEPLQIDSLQIRDWSMINGRLTFNKFDLNSNVFDLNLATTASSEYSISLVLKPTYLKILKAPVSFKGNLRIQDGKFDKQVFNLAAFGDKVILKFDETDQLALQINELDLRDYLNEFIPLMGKMSLHANIGSDVANIFSTFKTPDGSFTMGTKNFILLPEGTSLTPNDDGKGFTIHLAAESSENSPKMKVEFTKKFITSGDDNTPINQDHPLKIELSSTTKISENDLMADLLFSKKFKALTVAEKEALDNHKKYFQLLVRNPPF